MEPAKIDGVNRLYISRMKIRSLFISDAHIGSSFCQVDALLDVLERYTPRYLYFVGDFFDGWKLSSGFCWPDGCNDIIRRILYLVEKEGTEVKYAVGNHDEFLRRLGPTVFGPIIIDDAFIHKSLSGNLLRVVHGDYLDCTVRGMSWLAHMGDRCLSFALLMSVWRNWIQSKIKIRYWSFVNFLKRQVEKLILYVSRFETIIILDTKRRGCDGVICGHIHKPDIYTSEEGILYFNCGDWVENGTALVEYDDGRMELVGSNLFRKLMLPRLEGFDWPG